VFVAEDNGDGPSQSKGKLLKFPGKKVAPLKAVESMTFKSFHLLIMQTKLAEAASALVSLLDIPLPEAEAAAAYYAKKNRDDSQHPFKTMQLYAIIGQGPPNQALLLLQECFGLEGPIAIHVYDTLRQSIKL